MTVLLIEDEAPAADGLVALLRRCDPTIDVVGRLDAVAEAVRWFQTQPAPDLVLLDVQLADGLCFEIFEQVTVRCPVIFTTAYDAYALQAFQVLSVDYLLKPLALSDVRRALDKLRLLSGPAAPLVAAAAAPLAVGPSAPPALLAAPPAPLPDLSQLAGLFERLRRPYKTRFLVRWNGRMQYRATDEVAYFHAEGHAVRLVGPDGRACLVDYSLDELEPLLDPHEFFRLSRRFTVRLSAVREVRPYPGSRLRLQLAPPPDTEVLVSRERVAAFKAWLDGS